MKRIKKIMSLLLCATMILIVSIFDKGLFAVPVNAAETSGSCGTSLWWSYNKSTNTLTIYGSGKMDTYNSLTYNEVDYFTSAPWNQYCQTMQTVVINNGVTSIGSYAFYGCTRLTSVTIPDGVTEIGLSAFNNCNQLTSITIPDSVTKIGVQAFYDCTGLESITVTTGNSKYHSEGNCLIETASKTLKFGCKNSIIPSDGSVTSIGSYAFHKCAGLTSVTIPDGVTEIGHAAFSNCNQLTSIIIPDSVISILRYAFSGCTGLTSLAIGNGVTRIGGYAFYNCTELTNVTMGNSVQSIDDYAFSECINVTSITIPDSVRTIGPSAFSGCKGLRSINIPEKVYSIGAYAFARTDLISISIPSNSDLNYIFSGTFSECTKFKSIIIPDNVTYIYEQAFYNCTELTDIYYTGTERQWKGISIDWSLNTPLLNATKHYEYIPHIHDFGTWQINTPATCTESGEKCRICTVCGEEEIEKTPENGHTYTTVVTAPSCIEKGYITHTCTTCGDNYIDSYSETLGHSFGEWQIITASSCITNGLERRECSVCAEMEERAIPAHHTEQLLRTVAPTCTAGGCDIVRCTVCGSRYQINLTEPLGHHYLLAETATPCTEQGYDLYRCEHCGDTYTTNFKDPLGHDYQYTRTVAATCVHDGYYLYTCTRCHGTNETVIPALGHYFLDGFCLDCGVSEEIAPFDLNGDTELNAADLAQLKTGLLTGEPNAALDLNGDGVTNILDLVRIKKILARKTQ